MNPTPMPQVLAWLLEHHPDLHQSAEIDRSWLWLTANLKGDEHKATRDSIGKFGFRFAARGHTMPSGKTAHWGHSCDRPTRIKHKRKDSTPQSAPRKPSTINHQQSTTGRADPFDAPPQPQSLNASDLDEIAAAFA